MEKGIKEETKMKVILHLSENEYAKTIETTKTNFWHDFNLCQKLTKGIEAVSFANNYYVLNDSNHNDIIEILKKTF